MVLASTDPGSAAVDVRAESLLDVAAGDAAPAVIQNGREPGE